MNETEKRKTRNETSFRNTRSKDGGLTAHIGPIVAERVFRYCEEKGINRTKFVEESVTHELDIKERELLRGKSTEELVDIIIKLKEDKQNERSKL